MTSTDAEISLHTLLIKYYNDLLGRQCSEFWTLFYVGEYTLTLRMPGRKGTHSADRRLTWDVAEHTLTIGIRPGRGRTHSAYQKSNGTHFANRKLTRDAAEQTLPTGKRPWRSVAVRDYERKARSALRFFLQTSLKFCFPILSFIFRVRVKP